MAEHEEMTPLAKEDLRSALKEMKTYVDITEEDLKKIYEIALRHARQRLASRILVKEVMTLNVIAVQPDVDLHEAARLLSDNRISGMPVVDGDGLVIGVISEADLLLLTGMEKGHTFRDILRKILGEPSPVPPTVGRRVGDVMSAPALTVSPEDSIDSAPAILDERRIKRLPVVDAEGKLVGVVSRADIVRTIGKKA
jgi:CBS domain-containing membrane protein